MLEAQAYSGLIRVDGLSISDVTGLEAFENISQFNAMNNALTSIDLSQNTAITRLTLRGNNVNFFYMIADGNDDLTCIQHDAGFDPLNPPNTQANQWAKPSGASWSTVACQ